MCICAGCGKLIENRFYYCPWCGFSRVNQDKQDAVELRFSQIKEKRLEERQNQIECMEQQLDKLEKELSVLVLSYEMSK